jgi:hypothetical protein
MRGRTVKKIAFAFIGAAIFTLSSILKSTISNREIIIETIAVNIFLGTIFGLLIFKYIFKKSS